ncbi:MAG: hypothetical protein RLZZ272_1313 [Actinomycetota bacterium]|jgi:transcriptional repressor NrdR
MRCPTCRVDDDRVVDSRPTPDGGAIRRRRECLGCGLRYTTYERIELPELLVRKRSGRLVPFDQARVRDGMARAGSGRIPEDELDAAAIAIERALREQGGREVSSERVGLAVLARLRELDEVAYVRFASVYKGFEGAEDFERELSSLRKDAPPKDAED